MTAAFLARAHRQSAIVTTVAVLHVGAFLAIAGGMGLPALEIPVDRAIYVLPEPLEPVRQPPPEAPEPQDYTPERVERPVLDAVRTIDDPPPNVTRVEAGTPDDSSGNGPPAADYRGPSIRMRADLLAALIASCYPSAARRLDEEGRALVRIVVGVDGRAASWALAEGTGFGRLDSAVECVVRRLQFQPGRLDGRAVAAEVQLPIVFRLN